MKAGGLVASFASLLSLLLFAATVGWYCPLVIRRRVNPAPATWIIACLAMNLSMIAYQAIPDRSFSEKLVANTALYAAALEITIITFSILIVQARSGELRVAFDGVQSACLSTMALTLVYWGLHRNQPGVTFWTTQVLMVVAYFATIGKALRRRAAFDSIGNWGLIFLASAVGLIAALLTHSHHGIVNTLRGAVMSATTLGILIYYDRRNGNGRWRDELATLSSFYRLQH